MKVKIVYIGMLLLILQHPLYADIDAKIKAIQNAPVHKRFKLMNAFKREMAKMQENERIEALTKLTSKSSNKQVKKTLKELKKKQQRKEIQVQMETHHLGEDSILSNLDDQEGNNDD